MSRQKQTDQSTPSPDSSRPSGEPTSPERREFFREMVMRGYAAPVVATYFLSKMRAQFGPSNPQMEFGAEPEEEGPSEGPEG